MLQISFVIALLYLSRNWPTFKIKYDMGKRELSIDPFEFVGYVFVVYSLWHISGLFVTKFFQGQ